MSSIEVLTESVNGSADESNTNLEKDLLVPAVTALHRSDARTPPNYAAFIAAETAPSGTTIVSMQESSSSGSMTGSACTTVEGVYSAPSTPARPNPKENSSDFATNTSSDEQGDDTSKSSYETATMSLQASLMLDTPQASCPGEVSAPCLSLSHKSTGTVCHTEQTPTGDSLDVSQNGVIIEQNTSDIPPLSSWVNSVCSTLTGYEWDWRNNFPSLNAATDRGTSNPITYLYDDCSFVDHRLKLFFELALSQDAQEHIIGLVKAVVFIESDERSFKGILCLSNLKLYILEITSQEDDCPQDWLKEQFSCDISEILKIFSLLHNEGFGLGLSSTRILVYFSDVERCHYAHTFVCKTLEELGCSVISEDDCSNEAESLKCNIVKCLHSDATSDLLMFAVVTLLTEESISSSHFLVITPKNLILFEADLKWYLGGSKEAELYCSKKERMMDVSSLEIYSDSFMSVQFHHEETESFHSWLLHVATAKTSLQLVRSIRPIWAKLFGFDLEVKCFTSSLSIIEDLVKKS